MSKPLLVIAGVSVLVLGLIGGAIAFVVTRPTPTSAVSDYLSALDRGDVEAALAFLPEEQRDGDLLTEQMLQRSSQGHGLADLEVGDARSEGNGVWTVPVGMQGPVGLVNGREFTVREPAGGSDQWIIEDATIEVSNPTMEKYALSLNGVALKGKQRLFPGDYRPQVDSPVVRVKSSAARRILDQSDAGDITGLQPLIDAEALKTIETLLSDRLDKCLAMTSYTTPCGMNLSPETVRRQVILPGSVRRIPAFGDSVSASNVRIVSGPNRSRLLVMPRPVLVNYDSTGFGFSGVAHLKTWPAIVDFSNAAPTVTWVRSKEDAK